jgi:hypothetical protein
MNTRDKISLGVLACALGVAAILGSRSGNDDARAATTRATAEVPQAAPESMQPAGDPMDDPHAGGSFGTGAGGGALPPGHPAIDPAGGSMPAQSPHGSGMGAAATNATGATGAGSLTWKAPATFKEQPNPSSMRLATYSVPKSGSDKDDAELSITVAGGDTNANIERWAGQFEGGTPPQKQEKTIAGRKVTLVEMSGTYSGGMGALSGTHPGWTMYAAIVDAGSGQSYFFQMTGPTATVRAAKAALDTMIESIKPAS